jgi:hypothetical protein
VDYRHRRFAMLAAAMLGLCYSENARAASRGPQRLRCWGGGPEGDPSPVPGAQARWQHNRAGSERDEIHRSNCRSLAMESSGEPFCADHLRRLCRQEPCTFLMAT